jgi:hypothetical protein
MNRTLDNLLWDHPKLASTTLLVLLALSKSANTLGEATIKLSELTRLCRCSEQEVRDCLRAGVRLRIIEIIQNKDDKGARITNTYKFLAVKTHNGDLDDDIDFDEPDLPGIPIPKVKDPPPPAPPQQPLIMDDKILGEIATDPLYKGLDVYKAAWQFKRYCAAQKLDTTVRRFKVWLSRI